MSWSRFGDDPAVERACDRQLLDNGAVVAGVDPLEHLHHGASMFDDFGQVLAGPLVAARQRQPTIGSPKVCSLSYFGHGNGRPVGAASSQKATIRIADERAAPKGQSHLLTRAL